MSRKLKKIKKIITKVHDNSFEEILQVSAILKCLESACYYENTLKISDIEMIISAIQQKMQVIENCIDDLSLI